MNFICTNSPFPSGFYLTLASNESWGQRKKSVFLATLLQSQVGSVCCEGHGSCHAALPTVATVSQVSADYLFLCSFTARVQQLGTTKVTCPSSWCSITPLTVLSTVLLLISPWHDVFCWDPECDSEVTAHLEGTMTTFLGTATVQEKREKWSEWQVCGSPEFHSSLTLIDSGSKL